MGTLPPLCCVIGSHSVVDAGQRAECGTAGDGGRSRHQEF